MFQGLLKFAMEATKAEDAPGNSELGPMDEEVFHYFVLFKLSKV